MNADNPQTPPPNKPAKDLFNPTFAEQYALARKIGDSRFGSPCQHPRTHNGYCLNCLRRVIDKYPR